MKRNLFHRTDDGGQWRKPSKKRKFNVARAGRYLLLVGVFFWLAETWFFGWNYRPESLAEIICDNAAAAMICIGFVLGFKVKIKIRNA